MPLSPRLGESPTVRAITAWAFIEPAPQRVQRALFVLAAAGRCCRSVRPTRALTSGLVAKRAARDRRSNSACRTPGRVVPAAYGEQHPRMRGRNGSLAAGRAGATLPRRHGRQLILQPRFGSRPSILAMHDCWSWGISTCQQMQHRSTGSPRCKPRL